MPRTLPEKLAFKPGMITRLHAPPPELESALLDIIRAAGRQANWLMGFARDRAGLAEAAAQLVPDYRRGGVLWFCYPKKSGALSSDLTRDIGWDAVSAAGLLGVTQIALDATWSALRFRYRDEIGTLTRRSGSGRPA